MLLAILLFVGGIVVGGIYTAQVKNIKTRIAHAYDVLVK